MRLLWIAIVLALFQCNYGQEENRSKSEEEDLIEELFPNPSVGNKAGGSPPSQPLPPVPLPLPEKPNTIPDDDPNLEPKVSNVS